MSFINWGSESPEQLAIRKQIEEQALYKHWTDPFKSRRIFLSFGFILKYEELGRTNDDPRVRLSQRIERYFQ